MLLAAGSAGMWPLVYATVARTQYPEVRAHIAGYMTIVGYLATGFGFAAGAVLSDFAPWRYAFLLALVLTALPLLAVRSRAIVSARRGNEDRQPAAAREGASIERRVPRDVVLFGALVFLDYAAISSLAGIYGPYTRRSLDITLLQTMALLAPAGLVALLMLFAASRLSRPGRRQLELGFLYAFSATGAFALAATTMPAWASLAAIPLAIGVGGVTPIIAATVMDLSGSHGRGLVIGTLMSIEGLGSVAGPAGVAAITDVYGPRAGLAVVGGLFVSLLLLGLLSNAVRQSGPYVSAVKT